MMFKDDDGDVNLEVDEGKVWSQKMPLMSKWMQECKF